MKNHGFIIKIYNIKTVMIIISLLIFIVSATEAQIYFLNTYDGPDSNGPMQPKMKAVDLDTKSISAIYEISPIGLIFDKNPVSANIGDRTYLISFSENGGFNKNSELRIPYITYYSVFRTQNGLPILIRNDSLVGQVVDFLKQYPGENGFRFSLRHDQDSIHVLPPGLYSLNQGLRFRILRNMSPYDEPGLLHNISGFDDLPRIPFSDTLNLYYSFHNMQYWLIKLNSNLTAAIDSLRLEYGGGAAALFAYDSIGQKFYCLHVNYEVHGETVQKNRTDDYVNPEVLIYDPHNFHLLESHPINDYPDGEYPGSERGLADIVGYYIIYYFFMGDEIDSYEPAMLLIFDTRTNEATWLRVGWR